MVGAIRRIAYNCCHFLSRYLTRTGFSAVSQSGPIEFDKNIVQRMNVCGKLNKNITNFVMLIILIVNLL